MSLKYAGKNTNKTVLENKFEELNSVYLKC